MPRPPQSDDYTPEDLDGSDFAQSFDQYEKLGPVAATGDASTERDPGFREKSKLMVEELLTPKGPVNKYELLLRANYKCEECGVDLRRRTDLLNPHHPGQDKTTNETVHQILLCLVCHTKRDGHGFMRQKYYYDYKLVVRMKEKQGKWTKAEEEYERLADQIQSGRL